MRAAVSWSQPLRTISTARWRSASLWASFSASGSEKPASISTWSRQLSTFARSSCGGSAIWGISSIWFAFSLKNPAVRSLCHRLRGPKRAFEARLRCGDRRLQAAGEIEHPGLEHLPLGFCIGADRPDLRPQLGLDVREPALEVGQEFVAALLDPGDDLGQLAVDARGTGVRDLGHSFREHGLRVMGEL